MLLKCSETNNWREEFVYSKWLSENEDWAYTRVINCTDVTGLKNEKVVA
jgi:hypothetical protein